MNLKISFPLWRNLFATSALLMMAVVLSPENSVAGFGRGNGHHGYPPHDHGLNPHGRGNHLLTADQTLKAGQLTFCDYASTGLDILDSLHDADDLQDPRYNSKRTEIIDELKVICHSGSAHFAIADLSKIAPDDPTGANRTVILGDPETRIIYLDPVAFVAIEEEPEGPFVIITDVMHELLSMKPTQVETTGSFPWSSLIWIDRGFFEPAGRSSQERRNGN